MTAFFDKLALIIVISNVCTKLDVLCKLMKNCFGHHQVNYKKISLLQQPYMQKCVLANNNFASDSFQLFLACTYYNI